MIHNIRGKQIRTPLFNTDSESGAKLLFTYIMIYLEFLMIYKVVLLVYKVLNGVALCYIGDLFSKLSKLLT